MTSNKTLVQVCIICAPTPGYAMVISAAYAYELNVDPNGGLVEVMRVLELVNPERVIALRWVDDSWEDTDGHPINQSLARALEVEYQSIVSGNSLAHMEVQGHA